MIPEKRRPVSVDDILRLKRAERPPAEFWGEFDRQLRAKQLAALVSRRPWWQELSHAFSGIRRYHFPLGAAAILAISFVSMRVNHPPISATDPVTSSADATPGSVTSVVLAPGGSDSIPINVVADEPVVSEATRRVEVSGGKAEVVSVAANPMEFSRMLPLLGVPAAEPEETGATRLSRFVESALVATAAAEPVVSRTLLNSNSRFEARALPARVAVEPLQQITPPSERRGARILMAMVSTASVENAMRTTERAARRLSEEQLYDQIHRFGARGAGVNVKF